MSFDKHGHLVESLLDQSHAGALEWKPTARDSAFQVSFRANSLQISENQHPEFVEEGVYYMISLINSEGLTVDTFTAADLRDLPDGKNYWSMMREIYQLARRTALGADKVLKDILGELGYIPF